MSWLRIDDGFTANKKIAPLSDRDFRVWVRLLCHCAKAQDPTVDNPTIAEVSGLNSRRIRVYFDAELLDETNGVYVVHDWPSFQPKSLQSAERQARYRANKRQQSDVTDHVTPRAHVNPSRKEKASKLRVEAGEPQSLAAEARRLLDHLRRNAA